MSTPRGTFADFHDLGWRTGVFRALLIAAVAAGAMAAPVAILRILMSWRLDYLLPLAVFAALVGVFDTVRLGRPEWRDRRGLVFRLGEIMVLLVVAQIVVWSFAAGWPTAGEVVVWLRHPGTFLTGQFVATGLLLLSAWGLAVQITGDFLDLAIQPDEAAARESRAWGDTRSQWRAFLPVGRGEIVGRFAQRWVWGGVVLVVLVAMTRLSLAQDAGGILKLGLSGLGLSTDVLLGMLCYFLAGLLLLSDARLAVLRGRWYNEGVEIAFAVTRRWHATALLIVLAVAAIALLLPLGSTGGLGQALEWLITLIMRIMMMLLLLLSLLMSLLSYPFRFLPKQGTDGPVQLPQRPMLDLPTQTEAASLLPDWVGGAVLWIVAALVGGYLIVVYLRAHGRLRDFGGSWLLRVRLWWRGRRARFDRAVQARIASLRAQRSRSRSGAAHPPARAVRARELRPRERVRYLYLVAIRRAAERGLERPPHSTPLEFASDLDANWPDAEPEVEVLTEAFMDARYSQRDIAAPEAQSIQGAWRRLMEALRRPTTRSTVHRS